MTLRGKLVARVLPRGLDGDYAQQNKPQCVPSERDVDLSRPPRENPRVRLLRQTRNLMEEIVYEYMEDETSDQTTLDVTFANFDTGDVVFFSMCRDSQETVDKTLKRLVISLSKKTRSVAKNETATLLGADGDVLDVTSTTLKSAMTQALEKNLTVQIGKDEGIFLAIESCPPSIVRVQAFEELSQSIFVGIPLTVQAEVIFATHCQVDWYMGGHLALEDSRVFVPQPEHLHKQVSVHLTPLRNERRGAVEVYQFTLPVQQRPVNDTLKLRRDFCEAVRTPDDAIRVMSYNVLADQNAFSEVGISSITGMPVDTLAKSFRFPLIAHEILSHRPDLVHLQEVDEAVYYGIFEPLLREHGYQGYYAVKAGRGTREGVAMFWSLACFKPVETGDRKIYVIRDLVGSLGADNWESSRVLHDLLERRTDQRYILTQMLGHVVQIVPLHHKLSGKVVWSANTHLFFHPLASHIRVIQAYLLARQISREMFAKQSDGAIMCGDLNSSLETNAGRMLTKGRMEKNWRSLREHLNNYEYVRFGSEDDSKQTVYDDDFPEIAFDESFCGFKSAFADVPPAFTHHVGDKGCEFMASLDHILLSDTFEVLGCAPMPTLDQCPIMPSETVFSDHLSLVADVRLL